ncbi:hypothetical protein D3C76_628810 [compost metagenome]
MRCGNAVYGHGELGGLTGQVQVLVVSREGRVDHALFASLDADQGIFEAWDHTAGAQHQQGALGGTASKGFAVDLADEVDVQLVAVLGSTLNGFETGVLLAQDVQHVVDVDVANFGLQSLDGNVFETGHLELGEHFESGGEFQILALLEHFRLDGRRTGGVQLLLDDGLIERGLDQVAQNFLTSGVLEALTNDAHRHFARAETGNLGAAGSLLQALGHFVLDALGRHADGHAALKSGGAFYRNLHGYSSWHRRKPVVPAPEFRGSILVGRNAEVTLPERAEIHGCARFDIGKERWCGRREPH